jgi:hypothetical protein
LALLGELSKILREVEGHEVGREQERNRVRMGGKRGDENGKSWGKEGISGSKRKGEEESDRNGE